MYPLAFRRVSFEGESNQSVLRCYLDFKVGPAEGNLLKTPREFLPGPEDCRFNATLLSGHMLVPALVLSLSARETSSLASFLSSPETAFS